MARRIDKSVQHISHVENGESIGLQTLIAISDALEVDCNTLLGRVQVGAQDAVLDSVIKVLLSKMDRKQKNRLLKICELLLEESHE